MSAFGVSKPITVKCLLKRVSAKGKAQEPTKKQDVQQESQAVIPAITDLFGVSAICAIATV